MGLFCTFIIHDQSHISTFCTMKKLDIDPKVIYKSLKYLSLKQKPIHTTGIKWQNQSRLKAEAPLQSGHITWVPVFAADWWCVGKMVVVVMVDPRSGLMLTPSRGRDAAWPCHPSCEQRHRTTAATPPSISQPATRSSRDRIPAFSLSIIDSGNIFKNKYSVETAKKVIFWNNRE